MKNENFNLPNFLIISRDSMEKLLPGNCLNDEVNFSVKNLDYKLIYSFVITSSRKSKKRRRTNFSLYFQYIFLSKV